MSVRVDIDVVKSLPTNRPLVTGTIYKVEQPNGKLKVYTVNSNGEPIEETGLSVQQENKLDGLKTQSEITADIEDSKVEANEYTEEYTYSKVEVKEIAQKEALLFDTIADFRAMSADKLAQLTSGKVFCATVLGYYAKGDTPAPIDYFVSSTTVSDDGGSVIAINGVKFEHEFENKIDLTYFGLFDDDIINSKFNYISTLGKNIKISKNYTVNDMLTVYSNDITIYSENNSKITSTVVDKSALIKINNNLKGITVKGITFKGIETDDTICYSITVGNESTDINIINNTFDGFTGGVIFNYKNSKIKVVGNSFYNMKFVARVDAGGYGIVYQESYDTITSNNYFATTVERHHVYFAGNTILSTRGGENHIVEGNIFKSETKTDYKTGFEYSLKLMSVKGVNVYGNVFEGGLGSIWLTTSNTPLVLSSYHTENVIISNNIFKNLDKGTSNYSSCIGAHGAYTTVKNVTISNNIMYNCNVKSSIFIVRSVDVSINGNKMKDINGHGIEVDVTCEDFRVFNNEIDCSVRGVQIGTQWTSSEPRSKIINISNNDIKSGTFGVFLSNTDDEVDIYNNTIKSTTQNAVRAFSNITNLSIYSNKLDANSTSINLDSLVSGNSVIIYSNVFVKNRKTSINVPTGVIILRPINNGNFETTLSELPVSTTRVWYIGDVIKNTDATKGNWLRISDGTGNVLNSDWRLIDDRSTNVTNITTANLVSVTTADATDLTSALVLLNELKTKYNLNVTLTNEQKSKLNSKLDADRASGQQLTT